MHWWAGIDRRQALMEVIGLALMEVTGLAFMEVTGLALHALVDDRH